MSAVPQLTQASESWSLWLIPALPLLGAAINGLGGYHLMKRFGPRVNHLIAIAMPTGSFIVAVIATMQLGAAPALRSYVFPFIHIGFFDADMAFWLDPLSATLTLIITFVGTLIHVYSIGYMKGDSSYWRFFAYMNLFMAMMLMLVLGDNFLVMFIGWEGVGLCSYLLIAFWYQEKQNAAAGMKAFVVNRVGDFAFVIGLALLFWGLMGNYRAPAADGLSNLAYVNDRIQSHAFGIGGKTVVEVIETDLLTQQSRPGYVPRIDSRQGTSLRFDQVRALVHANEARWRENSPTAKTILGFPLVALVCICLFIAATGKSAQIPLYIWLPDAMAGPTPVSALIHAATMVTAGVYMIARLSFLYSLSPTAMSVVTLVGACTALFAATIGLFQYDIKKVLAYSTVSQLGYMFIGVGVGAYWAAIYHLLNHALFKATLFLGSGSVIMGCHHEQDMRKMGGLKKYMPSTARTYLIACIAITTAPFPLFLVANGFYSKDEILWKAFDAGFLLVPGAAIWALGFVGAACTSFYMWRSYYMTFTGEYRGGADSHGDDDPHPGGTPHESPRSMTWVLWTLASLTFAAIALGFWPLLGGLLHNETLSEPVFEHWLHPVVGAATESLGWLSRDPGAEVAGIGMHTWEILLALGSMAITTAAWFAARVLYKDAKSDIPARLLASTAGYIKAPYTLIYNKYFVDEAYDIAVVRRVGDLSRFLYAFDQKGLDGLVNLVGAVGRVAGTIDGAIDAVLVDGLVNGVARMIIAVGKRLRQTQTGRIQTYLAGALGGVLILVFINFVIFEIL